MMIEDEENSNSFTLCGVCAFDAQTSVVERETKLY